MEDLRARQAIPLAGPCQFAVWGRWGRWL